MLLTHFYLWLRITFIIRLARPMAAVTLHDYIIHFRAICLHLSARARAEGVLHYNNRCNMRAQLMHMHTMLIHDQRARAASLIFLFNVREMPLNVKTDAAGHVEEVRRNEQCLSMGRCMHAEANTKGQCLEKNEILMAS